MPMTSIQCAHVGERRCPQSVTTDEVYCPSHRYLLPMRTLGGSWSLQGSGALSYEVKLAREQQTLVPTNSARCDGFPYLTWDDVDRYAAWRSDEGPRPDSLDILDRFPVLTYETLGRYVRGTEEAIFSETGRLFALSTAHPEPSIVTGDELKVRYFRVIDPTQMMVAVRDECTYQVITLDTASLDTLTGAR